MAPRVDLHAILVGLLGNGNVFFQPPANVQMNYPCIVYNRNDMDTLFAGNKPYRLVKRYQVTVIDRDPDSVLPTKVAALPLCTFDRFYAVDNLNHDVFTLYF